MNDYTTILYAMALAPSAHNTQPWQFRNLEDGVEIYVDEQRHLSVSDPTKRELYLSIGCALFNGQVAAAKEGWGSVVDYPTISADGPVARLRITQSGADTGVAALHTVLALRRTDRSLYDGQPLTEIERAALLTLNRAPAVIECAERATISRIAELTGQGSYATLARPDFKEELSAWVRNSWTRQSDGMPGYAMGVPAALSLVAPLMVRLAPIHKQEGPKTEQQIESSSVIAVITASADTAEQWMRAGQVMERLWLEVTLAGLAAAPLAAAIEASGELRREVQKAAHGEQLPQAILRIGHSTKGPLRPTPRRLVEDCLRR